MSQENTPTKVLHSRVDPSLEHTIQVAWYVSMSRAVNLLTARKNQLAHKAVRSRDGRLELDILHRLLNDELQIDASTQAEIIEHLMAEANEVKLIQPMAKSQSAPFSQFLQRLQ
jgi:hypothetical protein